MKYFLSFCFIFVLAKFTEQQVVVLNSAKKVDDSKSSGEGRLIELIGNSGEKYLEETVETATSCTEEDEKENDNNADVNKDTNDVQETSEAPDEADNRAQSESTEKVDVPVDVTYDNKDSVEKTPDDPAESNGDSSSSSDNDSREKQFIFISIPNKVSKKHQKLNGPIKIGDKNDERSPHWHRWLSEIAAGNNAEIMGTNPDTHQPNAYPHLNRRFVLQYPYTEEAQNVMVAPDNKEIIPIQAPLEIVKKVAKQSMLEEAAKPKDETQDLIRKKILRTGEYWNAVWVEEMDPKSALRMSNKPVLGVIKAKIKPGSEFYNMVSGMKKISPRLLYVINDKDK